MNLALLLLLLQQPVPDTRSGDTRYNIAYRDGVRALDQDAFLSARASFDECLRIRPNDSAAIQKITVVSLRQIEIALLDHWPKVLALYSVVLLGTLFLGLRQQQKGAE